MEISFNLTRIGNMWRRGRWPEDRTGNWGIIWGLKNRLKCIRHIRESVFVLILGSAAGWSCKLLSDFLRLLKGLRGGGEDSQDSQDSWWEGGKGTHLETPWHVCNIQGCAMFYSNTRAAQQSVVPDSWKQPERKEEENVGDDCEHGETLTSWGFLLHSC